MESVLLKNTLSDKVVKQLLSYKSQLTDAYNSLDEVEKELLKDYYNKNLEFVESVINGKAEMDTSICLQGIEASVEYLKYLKVFFRA